MSDASPIRERSALELVTGGPFARLWWAGFISSTGDWITIFATFAVAEGIAGEAGIFYALAARIAPGLVFGAVAGVITDRVDRKRLIVFADVGRGLVVPFLAFVDGILGLVLISLLLEFLGLLSQSPRAAVVPNVVDDKNIVTANSLVMGASYGTVPIGAALGWLLGALPDVTLGGLVPEANAQVALAFFADSVTFLGSAAIVLTLPALASPKAERLREDGESAWRNSLGDLAGGTAFLWRNRSVRRVIAGMATALFGGGTIAVLGIAFVRNVLGADIRGFFALITALGGGVAIGIVAVAVLSERLFRRDLVFAIATVVTGLALAAASLATTVAGAGWWMVLFGTGAGSAYVMGFTHLHEEVEDDLRGRVFAAMFALMRIGLLVSMTIAVPLTAALKPLGGVFDPPSAAVILGGGAIIALTGLVILWDLRATFHRPAFMQEAKAILDEASRAGGPYPRRVRTQGDHIEAGPLRDGAGVEGAAVEPTEHPEDEAST